MKLEILFRPLSTWPGEKTPSYKRGRARFRSTWQQTLSLLEAELGHLKAARVVIEAAVTPEQVRLDGWLRRDAKPSEPGVILRIETKAHGWLAYPCDTYSDWQDNVRAIALALEALRAVDRYGVTRRGEQYRGWVQLPSGQDALIARGKELIRKYGSQRDALFKTHPDHGGNADDFHAVQAARGAA